MSRVHKDLTGQKFGRLTAVERLESYYKSPNGKLEKYWLLRCTCGREVKRTIGHLRKAKTCGFSECKNEWLSHVWKDKRSLKGDTRNMTSWQRMTTELKALRIENAQLKQMLQGTV